MKVNKLSQHKALILSLLTLSFPAIIEMSLNSLVGVADTMMISHMVGVDALAATGFVNQIIFMIIFIFSSFNAGATAVIARSYGEKDYKKLNEAVGQNTSLNILIGAFITFLIIIFSNQLTGIFDTTLEVRRNMMLYYNIIVYGTPFMFLSFSSAAALRGAGNTMTPMIVTGIVNVINIILNYVLISGVGPFPQLGIEGAAYATVISRFIGMLLYVYFLFFNRKGIVKLRLHNMKFNKSILKVLWRISLPGAVEQTLMQISFTVITVIVSVLDTFSEASFRILLQVEQLSFLPAIGFSIAAATLTGKALGEDNKKKAYRTGYFSFAIAGIWGLVSTVAIIIFGKFIVGMFTTEVPVQDRSLPVLLFVALNQIPLCLIVTISGALRGAGDTRKVMLFSIARTWFVYVPFVYLMINHFNLGLKAVWVGESISVALFFIIQIIYYNRGKWSDIKLSV